MVQPFYSFAKHWGSKALNRFDTAVAKTVVFGTRLWEIGSKSVSEALQKPPLDARGIPTSACPVCGEGQFLIYATFDDEDYTIATYMLDAMCGTCGTLLTAPTPLDVRTDEWT